MDDEAGVGLRKLGEVLIAEGAITEDQLAAAIAEQDGTGKRLGEILLARRSISRLDLANAFAEQHADARRPSTTNPPAAQDLAGKLAQMDALLAKVVEDAEELSGRLAALEALIPAIGEALDGRTR